MTKMSASQANDGLSHNIRSFERFYRKGFSMGRPHELILFDWMLYACKNFRHNASGGNIFFENLFKFAKFNQTERIEAIDVCRSPNFLRELSPQRQLFIREELARYDNQQQAREIDRISQRQNQERRQLMSLIEFVVLELEQDNFTSLTFPSRGWQAVPPPSQAVPPPSQAVPPPVEEEDFGNDIPPDFMCPLSLSIMEEPVMASDGHTYERENIQKWIDQKKISPITRAELLPHFFPNLLLKNQIDDWKKAYRKARTDAEA
jgi:U-box domain